ncbi:MAG: hypothetical protein CSH36_13005, partial [Thalassolituus sp.]
EEFALLLPGCQPDQLLSVAGRVQQAIRDMVVLNDEQKRVPVTASGSFMSVTPRPHQNLELSQIIDHLDGFLYQAKAQGRDRFLDASA